VGICWEYSDSEQALKWFIKAAEEDDIKAQYHLGQYYKPDDSLDYDEYDSQDYEKVVYWLEKVLTNRHPQYPYEVGYADHGINVTDYADVVEWYKEHAKEELACSQLKLADQYLFNDDREEEAVSLYEKLADKGNVDAQYSLAVYYEVRQNYEKTLYWYEKAAMQNHGESEYNLGRCYFYGKGVQQNDEKAEYWWKRSQEHGYSSEYYRRTKYNRRR